MRAASAFFKLLHAIIKVRPCTSDIGGPSFNAEPHTDTSAGCGWASDGFLDDSCRRSLSQMPNPTPLRNSSEDKNTKDNGWAYVLAPVTMIIGSAGDMNDGA